MPEPLTRYSLEPYATDQLRPDPRGAWVLYADVAARSETRQPDVLDVAWKRVEEVLPEGWWLQLDMERNAAAPYRVQAGPGVWSPGYESIVIQDTTPTAALEALRLSLQEIGDGEGR